MATLSSSASFLPDIKRSVAGVVAGGGVQTSSANTPRSVTSSASRLVNNNNNNGATSRREGSSGNVLATAAAVSGSKSLLAAANTSSSSKADLRKSKGSLATLLNDGGTASRSTNPAMLLPAAQSQAFIAIFEDAFEQLSVLAEIAPVELTKQQRGKSSLEDEVARIIKDQRHLELRYNEIVQEQETLRQNHQSNTVAVSKKNGPTVAAAAAGNAKDSDAQRTGHPLKKYASSAQNGHKINAERNLLQTLIGKTLHELKECRYDTLVATVEEEFRKKDILKNTIHREKEASRLVKQLKEEITRERQLLAEETVDRDQIISQLKDTIQEVKQLTTSELKYLKKETRAHEMTVKQVCQRKADKLDGEHGMVQRELAIEQKAHQTIMDFLALQRQELEVQIQEWMNKYETDTEAKAQELEALKQQRAADFERYEELVSQYEDLEKKVEEDRVAKEQAVTERKVTAQRVRAARKIQNWWRKLREAMKAAKKKKGKGSAKKKKK